MDVCGKWFDIYANKKTGKVHYSSGDLKFSDNQIQNVFSVLMADMLISVPDTSSPYGVLYLAFGRGSETWDLYPPDQDYAQTTLEDEFYRISVMNDVRYTGQTSSEYDTLFYYIDPDTYAESGSVTNAIEAKIFVPEGVADGIHREFALFGDDATATQDSGTMINWVVHPQFDKTGYELTRTVRLIFYER